MFFHDSLRGPLSPRIPGVTFIGFSIDLLPSEISADVTVKYAGSNEGVYYQLVSSDGKVSVKPATRTTVVFNGISDGFREIRYAGFPDDGDAVVDVAPDRWD